MPDVFLPDPVYNTNQGLRAGIQYVIGETIENVFLGRKLHLAGVVKALLKAILTVGVDNAENV